VRGIGKSEYSGEGGIAVPDQTVGLEYHGSRQIVFEKMPIPFLAFAKRLLGLDSSEGGRKLGGSRLEDLHRFQGDAVLSPVSKKDVTENLLTEPDGYPSLGCGASARSFGEIVTLFPQANDDSLASAEGPDFRDKLAQQGLFVAVPIGDLQKTVGDLQHALSVRSLFDFLGESGGPGSHAFLENRIQVPQFRLRTGQPRVDLNGIVIG
jgi:hypothetical protein